MPQRRRRPLLSLFAGGYTPQMREAVDQVPIPNEIKCCVCKRRRPKSLYSNNQLNYLRQAIFDLGYSNVRDQQVAKCGPCTNSQVCEELCHRCGHYRAIDQFARNQRNRDSPLCQPCMNYQMSLDPADQPLAIMDKVVAEDTGEDEEEELNSEPAGRSGSVALSNFMEHPGSVNLSGSLGQPKSLEQGIERALVLHDDSTESEGNGNRSGFARVKAHRAHQEPVPDPEPAPGWAPGTRKVNNGAPWKGGRFL
ncbi:Stc1 domain [Penicillium digitatum]|uniref:Stc1 domain n=1 Tax=Penicillium digitatum TaxID=36651 RepID=A0A7T6XK81_PENDI|nr:Stc1 domain [Penicillium digitatum]